MGEVIPFPKRGKPRLGYRELALALGCKRRFLEYQVAAGMPSTLEYNGRRSFDLEEVQEWLNSRETEPKGTG